MVTDWTWLGKQPVTPMTASGKPVSAIGGSSTSLTDESETLTL